MKLHASFTTQETPVMFVIGSRQIPLFLHRSAPTDTPRLGSNIVRLEGLKNGISELFKHVQNTDSREEFPRSYEAYSHSSMLLKQAIAKEMGAADPQTRTKLQELLSQLSILNKIAKRSFDHYPHANEPNLFASHATMMMLNKRRLRQSPIFGRAMLPKQKKTAQTCARNLVYIHNLFTRVFVFDQSELAKTALTAINNQYEAVLQQLESNLADTPKGRIAEKYAPYIFKKYSDIQTGILFMLDFSPQSPTSASSSSSSPPESMHTELFHIKPQAEITPAVKAFKSLYKHLDPETKKTIIQTQNYALLMNEMQKFYAALPPKSLGLPQTKELTLALATLKEQIEESGNIGELAETFINCKEFSPYLSDEFYSELGASLIRADCYHLATTFFSRIRAFSAIETAWSGAVDLAIQKNDLQLAKWLSKVYQQTNFSSEQLAFALIKKTTLAKFEQNNNFKAAKATFMRTTDDLVSTDRYLAMIDLLVLSFNHLGAEATVNECISIASPRTEAHWLTDTSESLPANFAFDALRAICYEAMKQNRARELYLALKEFPRSFFVLKNSRPGHNKNCSIIDELFKLLIPDLLRNHLFDDAKEAIFSIQDSQDKAFWKRALEIAELRAGS